jgi:hypothetical protein
VAIAVPSASNAPRCATGVSSLMTVWLITLMTEGTAMPIVASAILAGMPGTYGMTANAMPPSATQLPPSMPRATRLDTPRARPRPTLIGGRHLIDNARFPRSFRSHWRPVRSLGPPFPARRRCRSYPGNETLVWANAADVSSQRDPRRARAADDAVDLWGLVGVQAADRDDREAGSVDHGRRI